MSDFLRIVSAALIAVILSLSLGKRDKDITILLGIAACCMVMIAVVSYLQPVMEFLQVLESTGKLNKDWLNIILKAVGIGLISELCALICSDSGNAALGKMIHILGCSAMLWLSIPLMRAFLELLQKILGEI